MEPVGAGTRRLVPSNLPFREGSTCDTAFAAPVLVGMMLTAAARARRRSLCGRSRTRWSFVYECTVVMMAFSMPNVSSRIFMGAPRLLVVHDALLMMWWLAGS